MKPYIHKNSLSLYSLLEYSELLHLHKNMYTLIKFEYYLVLEKELACCRSPTVPALAPGRDALCGG